MRLELYTFSAVDLIPYILLYSLGIFFAFSKKNTKDYSLSIFLLMLIFSVIRYGIGYDYYSYMNSVTNPSQIFYDRIEPLSRLILDVCRFCNSYELYFGLYSLLTLYPIYYITKKWSINPAFSMLIYLLFPCFYISSLDIIRNALAFSMIYVSMYYLFKKKYIKCLIFICIATLSHTSALIALVLLGVNFLPKSRNFYLILILLSFLFGELIVTSNIFSSNEKFLAYVESAKVVGSMKYLFFIFIVFNYLSWTKIQDNNLAIFLLKIESLGIAFFYLFMIDDTLSFRFSTYFLMAMIPLIPLQISVMRIISIKQAKILVTCFFIGVISFQNYLIINEHLETRCKMSNYPYQTIFYKKDYTNTKIF